MYSDLSAYILQYLLSKGSVSISGLGTFSLESLKDEFELTPGQLSPPSKRLVFSDNSVEDLGFIQYIAQELGYTLDKARSFISSSVGTLMSTLEVNQQVKLSGLGKLMHDGEKKAFDPVADNFHPDYLYLPSLPLRPLHREETKGKKTSSGDKNVESEKIGKVSAIVRGEVAVVHAETQSSELKTLQMNDRDTVQNSYYYEEEKGLFSEIGWPVFWLLLLLLGFALLARYGCSKMANRSNDTLASSMKDETGEAIDSMTTGQLIAPSGEVYTGKYQDILTQEIIDQGCVIVVGSFKKASNAIRMRNRIIERGFQPYDEYHNGFNRVGIIFECLDHDLVDFLQDIRRTIESKAWYRIPGFEVAYE